MQPAEPVFVQDERRIAGDRIKSALVSGRPKLRRLVGHEIRNVDTASICVAPGPTRPISCARSRVRRSGRARSIIYDAAIARPGEAPAVAEIIFRLARVRLVNLIGTEDAGVNPPATSPLNRRTSAADNHRSVGHDADCRSRSRPQDHSVSVRLWVCVPAIDFGQNASVGGIARFIFRIPPIKATQRFVDRIVRLLSLWRSNAKQADA